MYHQKNIYIYIYEWSKSKLGVKIERISIFGKIMFFFESEKLIPILF